jgi:membrane protein
MNSRPKLTFASFIEMLKSTIAAFGEDRVGRHAAALAYFTIFSLSPLLVVIISIAALYFHEQASAVGAIEKQIQDTVGPTAAKAIAEMIMTANNHGSDQAKPIWATVFALLVALWGASGLFGALQDSLNSIWGVMPKPGLGFLAVVRNRFISFAMVLGVGFMLLVSLVASTVFSALSHMMNGAIGDSALIGQIINLVLGLAFSTVLFAAIFKILPDAKIEWRDVWVGAFVTAVLFTLGRFLLGIYLGRPGTASAYGSAGAMVVLLLWVNYAATILFAGAEFTKAYANKFGSKIEPDDNAISVDDQVRAAQGLTPQPQQGGAMDRGSGRSTPGATVALAATNDGSPVLGPSPNERKKLDFEHMLSVVGGAALVLIWAFRRQARKDRED